MTIENSKAEETISLLKTWYLNGLCDKLIRKLKRFRKDIMLNPDGILKNPWEEICIQLQTDYWAGWNLYDDFVESLCRTAVEELPYPVQCALSYDAADEDEGEPAWNVDFTTQQLKGHLYQTAVNYTNNRIAAYHDTDYLD